MAMMRKVKQMDTIKLLELVIFIVLFIIAVGLIIAAGLLSSGGNAKNEPTQNIKFSTARPDPNLPMEDTDRDGLPNIVENYRYGTNETNPDTDGDGMGDYWEVKYGTMDPFTHKYNLDPNDPTDAYEDPDNDGYDFNHNGKIDYYFDSVVMNSLHVPKHVDYTDVDLTKLFQNLNTYSLPGKNLVRLENVQVVDNGSYKQGLGDVVEFKRSKEGDIYCTISVTVADTTTLAPLEVCIESSGNRPYKLPDNSYVDIQGMFRIVENMKPQIVVRGGERFTNIMENQARRDYDNDGVLNETSPVNPDTDGDGMGDGWEVAYGKGLVNTSQDPAVWEWIYHIDPTWPGDAFMDIDGDAIMYNTELRGHNLDEFIYGTDPTKADTDQDSFDINHNGYDAQDRNAIDFAEIFIYHTDPNNWDTDGDGMSDGWEIWYGLNATNPNDRFEDPDHDQLVNLDEFLLGTNPRKWDTDLDGMPDGWEAKYGLNPLNPADAQMDSDVDKTGRPRPDGLINLFEYYNNTDPTNGDTDGDHLNDFEEIVQGFDVKVNHKWEHYFSCATAVDTDKDDIADDEDGDNYFGADEDFHKGASEAIDADSDGNVLEYDLNDFNEVYGGCRGFVTNASSPDTDGEGLPDWLEIFTDRDPTQPGIQSTDPTLSDTDGDGLTDLQEILGVYVWLPGRAVKVLVKTNPLKPDTDNDGLSDGQEVTTDFDPVPGEKGQVILAPIRDSLTNMIISFETKYTGNGIVNSSDPMNEDTDQDGMTDGYEYDYSDLDKDGMPTKWEEEYGLNRLDPTKLDTDNNGVIDSKEDFDLDGFSNLQEFTHRTDPNNPDTNFNGIIDSKEPYTDAWGRPQILRQPVFGDSDHDFMPDWWENLYGLRPDVNDSWQDLDSDGFANIDEYIYNTIPNHASPNDMWDHAITYSPYAVDENQDGIGDWWEAYYWGADWKGKVDPGANDDGPPQYPYGDNWTNLEEWTHQSVDPLNLYRTIPVFDFTDPWGIYYLGNDTDGDKKNDDVDTVPMDFPLGPAAHPMNFVSASASLNPIKSGDVLGDSDGDGMLNLEEYRRPLGQTDPTDPDTDQDLMPDGWEWGYGKYDNVTQKTDPDPLNPDDAYHDPDYDGVNYSRKWFDTNGDKKKEADEFWDIEEHDFDGNGVIDPLWENETFPNIEEYLTGVDVDADGYLELSSDPNNNCTFCDHAHPEWAIPDGFMVAFSDNDKDGLANWFEIVYHLNPNDPTGENASAGDPDGDGFNNTAEYRAKPWPTNPLDPNSYPGRSVSDPSEYTTSSRSGVAQYADVFGSTDLTQPFPSGALILDYPACMFAGTYTMQAHSR